MLLSLAATLLAAPVTAFEPKDVDLRTPAVRVPFGQVDSRVSVTVLVEGRGPYNFIVDTGASGDGRIEASLAAELGLKRVGEVLQDDGTGVNTSRRAEVRAETLRLGGATFRDVDLTAAEYGWIAAPDQLPVSGILGLGLFEDLLLTIDYPQYELVLEEGELARGPNTVDYSSGPLGLCLVDVHIDDQRFESVLDTGSMGGLLLPDAARASVRVRGKLRKVAEGRLVNNEFTIWGAPLRGTLGIAGHTLQGREVGFVDVFRRGNLGYEVLRDFAVTIDQRKERARFLK